MEKTKTVLVLNLDAFDQMSNENEYSNILLPRMYKIVRLVCCTICKDPEYRMELTGAERRSSQITTSNVVAHTEHSIVIVCENPSLDLKEIQARRNYQT